MAYISNNDYLALYIGGAEIPEEDFDTIAERASDVVDGLTMYRAANGGIDRFDEFTRRQFIKAVCAEVEHLFNVGVFNAVSGSAAGGSYSIGSTSVYTSGNNGNKSPEVSPLAVKLLSVTGLLYRGAATCE